MATIIPYLYKSIQKLTMKKSFIFTNSLVFLLLISLFSCTDPSTSNSNVDEQGTHANSTEKEDTIDMTPSLSQPDCVVEGQVLEDNTLWMPEMDIVAVIKANESTTKEGFEPSHRILEVLDGRSCEVKFTETLPENTSPDYPYYIAKIQYNKESRIIGILGYYDVYICDLDQDNKLTKLSPEYFDERLFDDPQSGMIVRLEVWEDYLLGYAQDVGAFAFDLSDKSAPKAVIPFAEWQNNETAAYHSLFLLPTEDGQQAIMPSFDAEQDNFMLHPIFDSPQNVSTNIPKNVRNNQFLVLRDAKDSNKAFAIDLNQREQLDLPDDVAGLKTQEILDWAKKR